jgi:branched-chain amino acid transport system substrate-binding protein
MPRPHLTAQVLAGAMALATAACSSPEPIRLGYVGGLTGRHSDLGVSGRNGAQLALAELNAAGGIGGRPLELVVRDDGQDPAQARRAVSELAALGVVAIVGPMTSSMAEAGLPVAEQAGVLMVSPTASAASFRGKDDGFVTLFPSNAGLAQALAGHLAARTRLRRVVVLVDQSNLAFSATWGQAFGAELVRRGGTVTASIPFSSGAGTSLGALAEQALASRPEAALVVANALDTAALCQQLRKRSAGVQLLGTDWGFTQDALIHGASAVEGALFTQAVDADGRSPRLAAFRQAYQTRYGRPVDFAAVVGWEAVQVLAEGLRRDPTRRGLKGAILAVAAFRGLEADFTIDRFGDALRDGRVMTVRDGRVVAAE